MDGFQIVLWTIAILLMLASVVSIISIHIIYSSLGLPFKDHFKKPHVKSTWVLLGTGVVFLLLSFMVGTVV